MARTRRPLLREPSHAPLSIFAPPPAPPRGYGDAAAAAVDSTAAHSPIATDDSAAEHDEDIDDDHDNDRDDSDDDVSTHGPSFRQKRRYRVMTPEQRELAHRMVLQGFCKADAARVLDVNRRTLGASLKKLEELKNGGAPVRSQGRPPVLTGPALAMAHDWADTKGVKGVSALKTQLLAAFGKDVSLTTIRRVLLDRVNAESEASSPGVTTPAATDSQRPVIAPLQTLADVPSASTLLLLDQRSRTERFPLEPALTPRTAAAQRPLSTTSSVSGASATGVVANTPHGQATAAAAPAAAARPKRQYRVMTPAERDFARRMVLKGFCKADAARVLDVNRSTLGASLKKLESGSDSSTTTSAPARAQGRPPVLTGMALAMVHDWADTKGVKDVSTLKAQLQSAFGKDVSVTTIRRVLLERIKSQPPSSRPRSSSSRT